MKKLFILVFSIVNIFCSAEEIDLGHVTTYISSVGKTYSAEDIEKTNSLNIQEFLSKNGYLVMDSGGKGTTSNVSIKGYAGFCIKVYIDGVLANLSTTGEFDWNSIDISSIESITIQDSPELEQGQFAGTVINIKTKAFGGSKLKVNTSVLSYEDSIADTLESSFSYTDYLKSFMYKANFNYIQALNNYKKPNDTTLKYNGSKQAKGAFTWELPFDDNHSKIIGGTERLSYNKVKAFGTGPGYAGTEEDLNSFNTFYYRQIFSGAELKSSLTYQLNNIDYAETENSADNTRIHTLDSLTILKTNYNFSGSINLTEEIFPERDKSRFTIFGKSVQSVSLWKVVNLDVTMGLFYNEQLGLEMLPQVSLAIPKIGITTTGFRQFIQPTFNQLYWKGAGALGNPDLKPEDGWSWVTKLAVPLFPLDFTYSLSYYQNKIRWTGFNPTEKYMFPENTTHAIYNTGTIHGLYEWKFFYISGNFTYTDARLPSGKQIMWVPFITSSALFGFEIKNFGFNCDYLYIGKRYINNDNTGEYDPVNTINLSFSYDLSKLTFYFKVNNLLDDRYIYQGSYTAPSRSFVFGFKAEY